MAYLPLYQPAGAAWGGKGRNIAGGGVGEATVAVATAVATAAAAAAAVVAVVVIVVVAPDFRPSPSTRRGMVSAFNPTPTQL